MNATHIENMRRLADFLDANAEKLTHFEQFDMGYFRAPADAREGLDYERVVLDDYAYPRMVDDEIVDTMTVGCGTVACAAGWATTLPGLEPMAADFLPNHNNEMEWIDWDHYIRRVFGLDFENEDDQEALDACFGTGEVGDRRRWSFTRPGDDYDPRAAARRLRATANHYERENA